MIFIGYFLAAIMGLILGVIGAGGSILTVPILVYFFKLSPIEATTYSLLVVGITALSGSTIYYRKKLIDFKAVFIFAAPSAIAVFLTRLFLIPHLPQEIFYIKQEIFIMACFAFLMTLAAFFMLKPIQQKVQKNQSFAILKLIISSLLIGLLTGFVGAGGGFLIVPSLLILFGLDIKNAIATSLTIIAINSLIGFKSDLVRSVDIDFKLLTIFLFLTIFGMIIGVNLNKDLNAQKLRKIFALFIIALSLVIILDSIFKI